MVAVPAFTGVAIPAAVTVATPAFDDTHAQVGVTTRVALFDRVAVAEKETLTPSTVVGLVGTTLIDFTLLATVRTVVPDTPP